jgi:hypothetical protein
MGGGLALLLACRRPDAVSEVSAVMAYYAAILWPGHQQDYSPLAAMQGHYAEKNGFARRRWWWSRGRPCGAWASRWS